MRFVLRITTLFRSHRASANFQQLGVSPEPLHDAFTHVAHAAEHLNRVIRHLLASVMARLPGLCKSRPFDTLYKKLRPAWYEANDSAIIC